MVDHCLLIDGDDTLWENNIYFEQAIEEFLDLLRHEVLTRVELRRVLDDIERANCQVHGYGARSFVRSLHDCYEQLHDTKAPDDHGRAIAELGERILRQEPVLIQGVEETLADLRTRHRLILLTKGDHEEQAAKVERSRLGPLFEEIIIVPEKTVETYTTVVRDVRADSAKTWMIGNSPKSDIVPALAAGLGAVYVPHADTWALEHHPFPETADRLLSVLRFTDLVEHF
ncbi:HAD family hydrolase [Streptomyces sp. NPDC026672]|uniref:HAD family hydrolase n=1 Tax=unclassified Streptomyces TaxID=2593676 RepID=UPI0033E5D327